MLNKSTVPVSGSPDDNNSDNLSNLNDRLQLLAKHCQKFKGAVTGRSLFQLVTTFLLFIVSVSVMFAAYENHYWLTFILIFPTAGFTVRLFIFQHDCGHQSFFKSRKLNDRVGRFLSIFTFTPYSYWRESHNIHHAYSGNLSKRGIGDIDTITVREYLSRTLFGRFSYRVYRHPIVMFVIGGPAMILILQRFPIGQPIAFKRIWKSIMGLNLALCLVYGPIIYMFGASFFFFAFLPVICVSAWIGGWLFFVQHQFEDTVWNYASEWDFNKAAVLGSSYFELPRILQWFSGSIGYHHLHHLCGIIPNYRLRECHEAAPYIPEIRKITLWESLKCARLSLWDEDIQKLVGFKNLKSIRA